LLHADLRAIESALNELERRSVKSIDCRRSGFSASEPIAKLRQFHKQWKAPFQTDYNQDSQFRPYDQLMCLRQDLEEALGIAPGSGGPASASIPSKTKPEGIKPGKKPAAPSDPVTVSNYAIPSVEQKVPSLAPADVETFEEKIWEQLIATPPVRGRSMTTVTVQDTRVLLSAWEVAAFISASGQDSDDLRRVIVARALLSVAIERRKKIIDFKTLQQAVVHARGEIPRFQERIDQLKRTLKTDSAVNLGISVKRLLALVEEAEQLQK
jgi:hypothetical protein